MPQRKIKQDKIVDYLNVLEIRDSLRQQLLLKQGHLTTPIKQVATIVGTEPAKLRHWEKVGLLSLERSSEESVKHRRYSVYDIVKLLIIKKLLDEHYSNEDVITFFEQDTQFIDELVNEIITYRKYYENSSNAVERLDKEEEAFFWRIFVPRAFYLSIRLLLEQLPDNDAWLLLPLSNRNIQKDSEVIQDIKQLPNLGEVLLGFCSSENPFFIYITGKPVFDVSKRYKVTRPPWPFEENYGPVGVHLLVAEWNEKRWRKTNEYALKGAGRLLQLLQETQSQWKPYLQEGNDFTIYNAPEFKKATLGSQTLDKMADQIIQLGEIKESQKQLRWHFCCVLLPRDEELNVALKRRQLVVQGQSVESPYEINKTRISPSKNSLSMRAYHSGQIIYRPDVADEEPDIASHEHERDIGSAIAVPIEGRAGQPIGVIYVASKEVDAFSEQDDWLLLRIMGRIIAEQVIVYQTRTLLVDKLPEVIAHPRVVDKYFEEFLLDNEFISHLEGLLKQIKPKQNTGSFASSEQQLFHDLAFISIGLTISGPGLDSITDRAIEKFAKSLLKEVGKRISGWIKQLQLKSEDIRLYCVYGEKYYLLLNNVPLEQAEKYTYNLLQELLLHVEHDVRNLASIANVQNSAIHLRLGVISYTYDMLQELLAKNSSVATMRVKITHLLDNALNNGRDIEGSSIAVWQPKDEKFIHYSSKLTNHRSLSMLDKSFVEQITNAVLERLASEKHLHPDDKNPQ